MEANKPVIQYIQPGTETYNSIVYQTFTEEDLSLVASQGVGTTFDPFKNQMELVVLDSNKNYLFSDYEFVDWKLSDTSQESATQQTGFSNLQLFPERDAENVAQDGEQVYVYYNVVENRFLSSTDRRFYIADISSNRKTVTLKTTNLSTEELQNLAAEFKLEQQGTYLKEFYLNFGELKQIIGLVADYVDGTLSVQLYEPLPEEFNLKATCWIQFRVSDPILFWVELPIRYVDVKTLLPSLQGPNFNLKVNDQASNSTEFKNITQLTATTTTSSYLEVQNLLNQKGISLTVDYSNYANFVHFSSAEERLFNFTYKVGLIEDYQTQINAVTGSTFNLGVSASIAYNQNLISKIVENFDGYEHYLYYESSSTSWPKETSTKPYKLASTTSTEVTTWLGTSGYDGSGQLYTAFIFDQNNKDALVKSIPEFIREDVDNANYEIFVNMIGQHFDNLYLYTEAVTQRYNADNRLDYGISKDLVGDALRSFGVKLYENNFSTEDLYTALTGLTPSGSALSLPNTTLLYPVAESGLEFIETIVTASNEIIPVNDLNKSIYKRLYHNLPLLVKKKGTTEGLRLLINLYGIPDTILRIAEFGGKNEIETNDYDYWQKVYNYAFDTQASNTITTDWNGVEPLWTATDDVPHTVAFRFKPSTLPLTDNSQSIWETTDGCNISLFYTASNAAIPGYSGAPTNPLYQHATLNFIPGNGATVSASISMPYFNGDWWTVAVTKDNGDNFKMMVANSPYNGETGNSVGFFTASRVTYNDSSWNNSNEAFYVVDNSFGTYFTGSLQEIRYYTQELSETSFKDFTVNPASIETADTLFFRAPLGGELYIQSSSIHPKVNTTSSFLTGNGFTFTTAPNFIANKETFFYDQIPAGVKTRVANKVQVGTDTTYGEVLSNTISVQQPHQVESYTKNTNYLEVGFSPQNEVNDDINSEFGYFNIGELIGDPREQSSDLQSYASLDKVRNTYFEKYNKPYNYVDYLRLIKFYDNSLFKIVKDFIPARTAAATGAIIKGSILERNRLKPAQASWEDLTKESQVVSQVNNYTGSLYSFTGAPAGSVNSLYNISQSWSSSLKTKAGVVSWIESSEYEFYNGEFSGSKIDVVKGELQDNPLLSPNYRASIADLQNLNVGTTSSMWGYAADLIAGYYRTSGSMPFNKFNAATSLYDTNTYTFTPQYLVVADLNLFVSGAFKQAGGGSTVYNLDVNVLEDANVLATKNVYVNTGIADPNPQQFEFNITLDNITLQPGKNYTVYFSTLSDDEFELGAGPNSSWKFKVENLTAKSTYYLDPTVYSQQNFAGNLNQYNDYYALYNNVYSNRVSSKYFDVDYSTNMNSAVNFGPIISQSAIYAQVQDSNMDPKSAYFKTRYLGEQQTIGDWNGRLQKEEVAGGKGAYMLYYDWGGNSLAERSGSANFHIQYLIDENGTLYAPNASTSSLYYPSVNQLFVKNSKVNVTTYNSTTRNTLTDTLRVYQPLKSVEPILYSDTGSLNSDYLVSGTYSSLDFQYKGNFRSFDFRAISNPTQAPAAEDVVQLNDVLLDKASGFNTTTYKYTMPFSSPVKGQVYGRIIATGQGGAGIGNESDVTLNLYRNGSIIDTDFAQVDGGGVITSTLEVQSPYLTFNKFDEYYLAVSESNGNPYTLDGLMSITTRDRWNNVTGSYFTVGQTTDTVLTSSTLFPMYAAGYQQTNIANSGFNDTLPFNFKYLDEVRYEGNENYVYQIISSSYDSSKLYVFLDREVDSSQIDINYFVFRRNVKDAANVMINVPTATIPGPGFIVPEYPSDKLKNNFDAIIKDFAEKNLI